MNKEMTTLILICLFVTLGVGVLPKYCDFIVEKFDGSDLKYPLGVGIPFSVMLIVLYLLLM